MTRDDILRMAREAGLVLGYPFMPEHLERFAALITALGTQGQEPVAWMVYTLDGESVCVTDNPADFTDRHRVLPLYTAPPQRKPLTDKEMRECAQAMNAEPLAEGWPELIKFARAIERAHGIGGSDA